MQEEEDDCTWSALGISLVVLSFIPNLLSFVFEYIGNIASIATLRYMRVAYFIGIAAALSVFAGIGFTEPLEKTSLQLRVAAQVISAALSLACAGVIIAIVKRKKSIA